MAQPAILYVEDDPLSRIVMGDLLKRGMHYENVTIFEDSANFMEKLETLPTKPDVIFLDIHMTPLDGFAMLRLIRGNKTFQDTRVIALTASVMNEEVKMLKDAGFDGVISKPLDADLFPKTLQRILNGEQVWQVK